MPKSLLSDTSTDRALIISADGHVTAKMEDYREYMPSEHHEEFDAFCAVYREKGSRNNEQRAMAKIFDPEIVEQWRIDILDENRLEGTWSPKARLDEMARSGLTAEVLFPDFGLPYELYSPLAAATVGYHRTREQMEIANRAYNRWLADYCAEAPERFAGQAYVSFEDVDAAIAEIRWAKEAGLRGVLLPMFTDEHPIFHERFDPIWSLVEELEMPVNSHISISATMEYRPTIPPLPHPSVALPIFRMPLYFFCHQILNHLIWGGVLERHPDMQVVFTEQGSGWVIDELEGMDYSWEGSLLRRDIREVVGHKPSDYFARQCHLGSSIFSLAEVKARHLIGVDRMTLGMDYPHPEGTWGIGPGTLHYLQATVGAANVPPAEARLILGENALKLWGFDPIALAPVVNMVGPSLANILQAPETDEYPRGDVNKPLGPW